MRQTILRATVAAALLLASVVQAVPHDDSHSTSMEMDMSSNHTSPVSETTDNAVDEGPLSYFAYSEHGSAILAHIILMVIAWCFVLPVGM